MSALEVIALDAATPQLRAPGAGDTYTFPRAVEMPLGTANGVLYLNGSKVVSSGSALTFDGAALTVDNVTGGVFAADSAGTGVFRGLSFKAFGSQFGYFLANSSTGELRSYIGPGPAWGGFNTWFIDNSEAMRLTSTGLGIGTSSPAYPLDVTGYGRFSSGIVGASGLLMYGDAASATGLFLDSSGNLGLGVTPSAWGSARKAIQIEGASLAGVTGSNTFNELSANRYINASGQDIYIGTGEATVFQQTGGGYRWYTAASGNAGDPISFTQALTLDGNRNLLLNGTAAPASGVGTFAIFNGTAPTGSVTDGCVLYTEDVSSSSELKVRDEAGNVTTLSPHNFELIPEGPSEDMAWSYYSERDGKRINVDMLKAIRLLEKLSGEQLVYKA